MIRREFVGKTFRRVMAVTLATTLSVANPMLAIAEEGDGVAKAEEKQIIVVKVPDTHVADEAQTQAETTDTAIETAEASAESLATSIVSGDKKVESGEAGTATDESGEAVDLAEKVIEAAEGLLPEDGGKTDLAKAEGNIETAKENLEQAEIADFFVQYQESIITEKVQEAEKLATDVTKQVEENTKQAETLSEAVKNASTIAEANEAYEDLTKLAVDTAKVVKDATENYNQLKELFDQAQKDYQEKVQQFSESIATASNSTQESLKELGAAKEKVDALESALEKAEAGVNEVNKGALDIISKQEKIVNATYADWSAADKLFNSIMENYFIAQKVDGATNAVSTRIQGYDNDAYNYFQVTYTDANGDQKTEYYNYKLADANAKSDINNIVIFEKTAQEVAAAQYAKEKGLSKNDTVYTYTIGGEAKDFIAKSEVDKNLAEGIWTTIDGKIYVVDGQGNKTEVVVEADLDKEAAKKEETQTKVEIDEDSCTTRYIINDNGKLVKETLADVTRTDYKYVKGDAAEYIKGGYTQEQIEAAIESLKASGDAELIEAIEVTSSDTYYLVNGKYTPIFTVSIPKGALEKYVDVYETKWGVTGYIKWTHIPSYGFVTYDVGDKNALNNTLNEIKNGNTILSQNLNTEWHKRSWHDVKAGNEEYFVYGTVTYTKNGAGQVVITSDGTEYTSVEAAKADLLSKMGVQLANDGISGNLVLTNEEGKIFGAKSNNKTFTATESYKDFDVTVQESYKKYSYYLDYLSLVSTEISNETITEEDLGFARELLVETTKFVQNSNFNNKNFVLNMEADEEFNKFLQDVKDQLDKYAALREDAAQLSEQIDVAKEEAEKLQDAINTIDNEKENHSKVQILEVVAKVVGEENLVSFLGLKENETIDDLSAKDIIRILEEKMEEAGKKLKASQDELDKINEQLEESGEDLEDTIRRLTPPAPTPGPSTPSGEDEDVPTVAAVIAPVAPALAVAAPVAVTPVVANAAAPVVVANAENGVEIADNPTPLADTPAAVEESKEAKTENVEITDSETPLAPSIAAEDASYIRFIWWGILLVLLVAAAAYYTYKKRQSKKIKSNE